jgi:DNA-directed RNA polymerase specialized sigma24 family protein
VEVSDTAGASRTVRRARTEGLTPESLEALLVFLDADRHRAGLQYEAIRRRLVRLFEWRGFGNPEDLADETINRVARRIQEGTEVRSADPYGYFCGVAHLLSKEVARRASRERAALEREDWQPAPSADEPDADDRLDCLRHCLQRLPGEQRELVLRYHQESDHIRSRQMLSQQLGIPMNALRIRVHRVRRKLEDCVRECLRVKSIRDRR